MRNILHLDTNVRGKVMEELASRFICFAVRCKQLNSNVVDRWHIHDRQKEFLKFYWKYLDIVRCDSKNQVSIYEVKSRRYEYLNRGRHAISPYILEVYKKALALGIKVKLFEILLFDNWNFDFAVKDFREDDFSVSYNRGRGSNYRFYN